MVAEGMANETSVFIAALKRGTSASHALEQYCWAKMAVPIDGQMLRNVGEPMHCPPALHLTMAGAMGADAFEAGKSDDEIAEAFNEGLAIDAKRDVRWRTMSKDERPTHSQLVRSLTDRSLEVAGRLLGYNQVAQALTSR